MINLSKKDQDLVRRVRDSIRSAIEEADMPSAVAKRIASEATKHRNRGRKTARKRYPFRGFCEASGAPLAQEDAVLDELEPEQGYSGRLRWVCPKANNSGKRSCGVC